MQKPHSLLQQFQFKKAVAKPEVAQLKFRLLLAESHGGAAAQRLQGCERAAPQQGSLTLQQHSQQTWHLASAPLNKLAFFLFVFIYLYFQEKYHISKFLPQHSGGEKTRKSLLSLRVIDAGQASVADRQCFPWSTTCQSQDHEPPLPVLLSCMLKFLQAGGF